MMRARRPRAKSEPTIALINIVFLMLIFFMVAGTLSPPIDTNLTLVDTSDLEGREPTYALVIDANGAYRFRGAPVTDAIGYLNDLDGLSAARLMPDRAAPATAVLQAARELRAAGVETVFIVTEKVQP